MLKRLAILAIVAILAWGATGQPDKGGARDQNARVKSPPPEAQSNDQGSQKPPTAIAQVSPQKPDASEGSEKNKSDRELAGYTLWLAIFTGVLVVVSTAQGYFLFRQARHLKKHGVELHNLANAASDNAKAARDAAEATLKQAEHIETTERAWLIVNYVNEKGKNLEDKQVLELHWAIKNVGGTPAILLETKARFHVINIYPSLPEDPVAELSQVPDYGEPIIINERLLAPGDSIGYFTKWERRVDGKFVEFAYPADSGQLWLVAAYGYVRYRDTFGKDHESRSCDVTFIAKNNEIYLDYRPHPKAPSAYNRCS